MAAADLAPSAPKKPKHKRKHTAAAAEPAADEAGPSVPKRVRAAAASAAAVDGADADAASPKKKKKKRRDAVDAADAAAVVPGIASISLVAEDAANAGVGKGKARAGAQGEFRTVRARAMLALPPVFAGDARAGAAEMLDSLVMRYVPALQGVVLAHSGLSFGAPTARVLGDSPFAAADVRFAATTWAPAPGMRVRGRLVLAGPDHAALLVHRTFNAAVPRAHIPPAWAFEHGPAENDPEFGAGADGWGADGAEGAGGRWVSVADGAPLGGEDGIVEFTVIGMTVSHQMLSLVGSLQPDPFSPRHAVQAAPTPAKGPAAAGRAPRAVVQDEEEDEAAFPEDTFGDGDADDAGAGDGEEEDEGGDGVEDAFAALGALADADVAAARAEREREEAEREEVRAKAEKAERKERKRKAKEEGRDEKKKRRKEQAA